MSDLPTPRRILDAAAGLGGGVRPVSESVPGDGSVPEDLWPVVDARPVPEVAGRA